MDKIRKKKKWTLKKVGYILGGGFIVFFVLFQFVWADRRSKLKVDQDRLTISTVTHAPFQERIPETGTVLPKESRYLDAIEGGIVQQVMLESGTVVKEGDVILTLANSNLQLDVLNREAQLYEQINLLRQTRLSLEQNSLRLKTDLAEINYQIGILGPQYERSKELYKDKVISLEEYQGIEENYKYQIKRRKFTYESFKTDSISTRLQLRQLAESEARMIRNLDAVSKILDNLVIKAPINGQLSRPELEIGQSVNTGQRLGQVDVIGSFKVRVEIDEIYLPRIDNGQIGRFTFDNESYAMKISKIYPTVNNGVFSVDMDFVGDIPPGIKRGQTLRIRIELSQLSEATLVAVGGFYQDTGGNWVYVLNEDGKTAEKRNISLGRKNPDFYEVTEGLQAGDKVITSSYRNFGDNEVLVFN
ncbi:MAG: HlyD family efflux transporter periplasmic adaptor subunit [Bacteroidota bacterium]